MSQNQVAHRVGTKFAAHGLTEKQVDDYIRWFFADSLTQETLTIANTAYHERKELTTC